MSAPIDVLAVLDDIGCVLAGPAAEKLDGARAAIAELIKRERKLREYIKAIKVQATEAPACDEHRLNLVVMYCDDALANVCGGAK